MIDWIVHQQAALSLILAMLWLVQRYASDHLSSKFLYRLWLMVPLALLANNLPTPEQPVVMGQISQYLVSFHGPESLPASSLSWQLLWLAGAVIVALATGYSHWSAARLADEPVDRRSLALSLPANLPVFYSLNISGPLLVGAIRPKLLLPADFEKNFNPLQQQLILRHELVHYRRGDNLFNMLAVLVLISCWFNPLVWLAWRSFRRAQELSCDSQVLHGRQNRERLAYAKALVFCAEQSLQPFSFYSHYGEKHTMLKRICNLKTPAHGRTSASIAVSSLFATLIAIITVNGLIDNQAMASETTKYSKKAATPAPKMRVEPQYPIAAARQKKQGEVTLKFDIKSDGSTANITVVKSTPQGMFDKVAKTALSKWVYKKSAEGKKDVKVQLDFRLDDSAPSKSLPKGTEGIKVTPAGAHHK